MIRLSLAIHLAFCLALLLPTTKSESRSKDGADRQGQISFENTTVDFGNIKRGQKLTAKFNYRNRGSGPLTIQGVQAPCDCTTIAGTQGKTLAPNESGVLEVIFNSTDYIGRVSKAITIVTNERAMPARTLSITANITSEIDANPPIIDFGDVIQGQEPEKSAVIRASQVKELTLDKIKHNADVLSVTLHKQESSSKEKEWKITIKLKPKISVGFLKESVTIINSTQNLPELPIPVRATIKGQISPSPSYVEFGALSAQEKSSRSISLDATSSFDVKSHKIELLVNGSKIENPEELLTLNTKAGAQNYQRTVQLELKNTGKHLGSVHGKLVIATSNQNQSEVTLDFYAFFR